MGGRPKYNIYIPSTLKTLEMDAEIYTPGGEYYKLYYQSTKEDWSKVLVTYGDFGTEIDRIYCTDGEVKGPERE